MVLVLTESDKKNRSPCRYAPCRYAYNTVKRSKLKFPEVLQSHRHHLSGYLSKPETRNHFCNMTLKQQSRPCWWVDEASMTFARHPKSASPLSGDTLLGLPMTTSASHKCIEGHSPPPPPRGFPVITLAAL